MEISLSNKPNIHQLSALGLIPFLTSEQDEVTKRRAQNRFYEIFKDEIWTFCKIVTQNNFGHTVNWEEVAQEIHADAFRVALDKVNSFKLPDNCSEIQAYNTVRKWIARTANFIMLKHITKAVKDKTNFDEYKAFVVLGIGLDDAATGVRATEKNYDEKKFNLVWAGLSPFAKEIVFLSYEHDCFPRPGQKNKKHMPPEVLEPLYAKYMTDNDNYRQTKTKAFKKILNCLKT